MASSYISEDLLSSKKNYQWRDDLSRKLTNFNTDECLVDEYDDDDDDYDDDDDDDDDYDDDYDEEYGSPPPPPPPKYVKARKPVQESYHIPQPNGEKEMQQTKLRDNYVRNVPYDADDFKFFWKQPKQNPLKMMMICSDYRNCSMKS